VRHRETEPGPRHCLAITVYVAVAFILGAAGPAAAAGLTHADRLASVYDAILAARFDEADQRLDTTCPPAPGEACLALRAVSLWWQILMDPESRRLDTAIQKASALTLDAAEAWTRREPRRAEAWFYLAAAEAPLVQWHALRGQHLSAARAGNRTRSALERALALDPTLHDAQFGIGVYRYYADVAPAALRMLRWLLLLPGGDRRAGLRQMLAAREHGQLLAGEADFQLHVIYLWYERDTARALELLRGLDRRYPSNPLFLKRIAEVERGYLQDHPASAATWQHLVERARSGQVAPALSGLAEVNGRLGLAIELEAMFETDRAAEEIAATLKTPATAPHGARARAHLQLGRAYDRLGRRALAVAEYRAVERDATDDAYGRTMRDRAREGLERTPDPTVAEAYRLSIEGLRALEAGDRREALARLARSIELNPVDGVARYRYARALEASGDHDDAARQLAALVAAAERVPAVVRSRVFVAYAEARERAGERAAAIEFYRRARDVAGGAPDARDEARGALARLAP
jgi:tetratricopeptide (TPR) repeat protein